MHTHSQTYSHRRLRRIEYPWKDTQEMGNLSSPLGKGWWGRIFEQLEYFTTCIHCLKKGIKIPSEFGQIQTYEWERTPYDPAIASRQEPPGQSCRASCKSLSPQGEPRYTRAACHPGGTCHTRGTSSHQGSLVTPGQPVTPEQPAITPGQPRLAGLAAGGPARTQCLLVPQTYHSKASLLRNGSEVSRLHSKAFLK